MVAAAVISALKVAKAAGEKIATQFLTLSGIPIEPLEAESVDLRLRLSVFIYWAKQGRVKLVGDKKKWERFMGQVTSFPDGKHDDLLAVCAGLTQMHKLKIDQPKVQPKVTSIDFLDEALGGMYR